MAKPQTFSRAAIDAHVRRILTSQLGIDESEVTPVAHIIDDLGADSLDAVTVIMEVEAVFDLNITDLEAEQLAQVRRLCEYIERRLRDEDRFVEAYNTGCDPGDETPSRRSGPAKPGRLYCDDFGNYFVGAEDGRYLNASHQGWALLPGALRRFTHVPMASDVDLESAA